MAATGSNFNPPLTNKIPPLTDLLKPIGISRVYLPKNNSSSMKKPLLVLFTFTLSLSSFAFKKKSELQTEPLFQLGAGPVYSSIDLNRYINSTAYRGLHLRLVTHRSEEHTSD